MVVLSTVARSLARMQMGKLFRLGYTGNQAAKFLRKEIGGLYRRQVFQADWREITGVEKVKESFRFIPKKYRLSFGLTVPRATPLPTNYQYLFRLGGLDPETGQETYAWTSMLDDVRMEPGRAEDIMLDKIRDPNLYTDIAGEIEEWSIELYVVYRTREVIYTI